MGGSTLHESRLEFCIVYIYIYINEGVSDFHEIRDGLVLYEYDMQLSWNSEIPRVLNMTPPPPPPLLLTSLLINRNPMPARGPVVSLV